MPGETVQEVVRHRAMITACTIGATVLQLLDQTIANVALPFMQGSFSASFDEISWVLTSYITASAIMTAPVGWLAARYGRKSLYVSSMLHDHIDALRRSAVTGADRGVSRIARRIRCRSGAIVAGHSAGHLSARATRLRHGDPGNGDHARADHGADPWRLADRNLQLALGVLHQPAVRPARRRWSDDLSSEQRPTATAALRLAWIWDAGDCDRCHAVDARPWPGPGLVYLS